MDYQKVEDQKTRQSLALELLNLKIVLSYLAKLGTFLILLLTFLTIYSQDLTPTESLVTIYDSLSLNWKQPALFSLQLVPY